MSAKTGIKNIGVEIQLFQNCIGFSFNVKILETFCTTHVKQYRNAKTIVISVPVMTRKRDRTCLALRYCFMCVVQKVSNECNCAGRKIKKTIDLVRQKNMRVVSRPVAKTSHSYRHSHFSPQGWINQLIVIKGENISK